MTTEQVKKALRKKFKSITNFAVCAGLDRMDLQKLFARKERAPKDELKRIMALVKSTEFRAPANTITKDKLDKLQKALDDAGGPWEFSKLNPTIAPDLNHERLYRQIKFVYDGDRTRMSKFVKRLFDHFRIT